MDRYIECLCGEMDYVAGAYRGKALDSVYIGGGTPTTLSAERLERLLSHLEKTFDLSKLLEFTVEAGRADSITKEKLKVIKSHGVSRISINPQTMKEETLKILQVFHPVLKNPLPKLRRPFYRQGMNGQGIGVQLFYF